MKFSILFVLLLALTPPFLVAAPQLTEVGSVLEQQVTGVGVSKTSGRVFVNYPDCQLKRENRSSWHRELTRTYSKRSDAPSGSGPVS